MSQSRSVDHLFLLIGENPLPNYLAAMLLLAEAGSLYLICTERTRPQAERLIKAVRSSKDAPLIAREKYIFIGSSKKEHPKEIYEEIHSAIKDANGNGINGTVGLHYTGGTKIMTIHAYRAVHDLDCEQQFSYLDSETLSIGIENNGYLDFIPVEQDVSLSTIFVLHGIELKNEYSQKPRLAAVSNKIAQSIIETSLTESEPYNSAFKKLTIEARESVLSEAGLIERSLAFKEKLTQEREAPLVFKEKLLQQGNFKNGNSAKVWATGGHWLEDYVLQQVNKIAKDCAINDVGVDFPVLVGEGQSQGHRDDFQLDVVFIRHYQLFTITCTTSPDKKTCKQKLLEAYVRAGQIGGSEARVALVCGVWDTDKIKAEMDISINSDKVRVFGYRDWPNLSVKIANWIEDLQRNLS